MRAQEKAIIEAMSGGALRLEVGFLTHGELLECVRFVSKMLGGDPQRLSRNTVQAWVRDGVFGSGTKDRRMRNRLYSGLDVMRLAAIFHATHVGISIQAAGHFADVLRRQLDACGFERWAAAPDQTSAFDPRDYIIAFTDGGRWKFVEPLSADDRPELTRVFGLRVRLAGLTVILNSRMIAALSIARVAEKWKEKAVHLRDKIEAYLKRRRSHA